MTAYRQFVSAEMKNRPAGTPTKEYMKTIAEKWHGQKTGGANPTKAKAVVNTRKMRILPPQGEQVEYEREPIKLDTKPPPPPMVVRRRRTRVRPLLPPYERTYDREMV